MQSTSQGNWFDITAEAYIENTRNRSGIIWLGRKTLLDDFIPLADLLGIFSITDTRARACRISSSPEWSTFIDSCYSLGCANVNENWRSRGATKISFRDWMHRVEPDTGFFRFDETEFIDSILCTVYDTQRQARLMVDGIHRANAITRACDEGLTRFPPVTIIECYGAEVDIIFPCDIRQLPAAS